MNSRTTRTFWKNFERLPGAVRDQAVKAYALWRKDPGHPSLHFKPIHAKEQLYTIRIALGYRALGLREGDTVTWFWIGSRGDYERLIG